jgi:hypothetical protein
MGPASNAACADSSDISMAINPFRVSEAQVQVTVRPWRDFYDIYRRTTPSDVDYASPFKRCILTSMDFLAPGVAGLLGAIYGR